MESRAKVTRTVPVVAIRESVVFPHSEAILSFGRPKSVSAINAAFREDRVVAIFTQKDSRTLDPGEDDLYKVGTIATITQMMQTEGEVHTMVHGQARIKLEGINIDSPHLVAEVSEIEVDKDKDGDEIKASARGLLELFKKAINLGKSAEITSVMKIVSGQSSDSELVDLIASTLDMKMAEKQKLLEETSLKARLQKVNEYLIHEVNVLDLEKTISVKTQKRFEDQMRRAMLREKKRTIEEELGEEDGDVSRDEVKEYSAKIKEAGMPKDVEDRAKKELKRLSQLSPHNPEGGYIRNYLDWLTDMPWSKKSKSNVSIKKASDVLNEDHYGLEKVKERVLEYLAVMKTKKEGSLPTILCFIGPPGVGKTSIGKSIAKALGRKFSRVSLGGIRDEAEIRGHRRTYVGALPGRIIQGIKNAGTKNPVFMLDEIDKVGVDFRGDPTSALLEALDPEQNKEFSDHYLEVPFDLSDVMFICTGNTLDGIPIPLRDRMEMISFSGYTQHEKLHIAKKYLWPKQTKLNGLSTKEVSIEEKALLGVIEKYTREAGVRELERNLATICRKIVRQMAEKKKYPNNVGLKDVEKFLGPRKFSSQIVGKKDEVGMSTGLAVTSVGGDVLFIEVALMPGKGRLTLTGQLGDVMRESAKAAFTWAKAHWQLLGLKSDFGMEIDVHIHVPEGAVPKDGPSAGVALTSALVSALTGVPTRRDVAMTGEITLRGNVMEIGGVKEKVIAAHRAGVKKVILPKDNKKDMEEVPSEVRKDITFIFATKIEEVLPYVLVRWPLDVTKEPRVFPFLTVN